jgi:hypothetical protein
VAKENTSETMFRHVKKLQNNHGFLLNKYVTNVTNNYNSNKHSKELVEEDKHQRREIQLIFSLNFNGIPTYNLFTYP